MPTGPTEPTKPTDSGTTTNPDTPRSPFPSASAHRTDDANVPLTKGLYIKNGWHASWKAYRDYLLSKRTPKLCTVCG
jgi:hypothetical protein